jgi:hypothetical protein
MTRGLNLLGDKGTDTEINNTKCLESKNTEVGIDTRRRTVSTHTDSTRHVPGAEQVLANIVLF